MEPSFVSDLRAQYALYSDEALIALAGTAHQELVPAAREVLDAELKRRGIQPAAIAPLLAPSAEPPTGALLALVSRIQHVPCPHCGSAGTILNGFAKPQPTAAPHPLFFLLGGLLGYFLGKALASPRPDAPVTVIGCPSCLRRWGVRLPGALGLGTPWPPTPQLVAWVREHFQLLERSESNPEAFAALLRMDRGAFLRLTAPLAGPQP